MGGGKSFGCRRISQRGCRAEAATDFYGFLWLSLRASPRLQKVEQIGGLAMAIFGRVAHEESYGEAIGRPVRIEEIQPVVNELLADNLLMRVGHGLYDVADPFVQEIWRERQL